MTNIAEIERQIFLLDKWDEAGGESTQRRLKRGYEVGDDATKKDLLEQLEKEILAYGMNSQLVRFGP